jgi:hypothetical protein
VWGGQARGVTKDVSGAMLGGSEGLEASGSCPGQYVFAWAVLSSAVAAPSRICAYQGTAGEAAAAAAAILLLPPAADCLACCGAASVCGAG